MDARVALHIMPIREDAEARATALLTTRRAAFAAIAAVAVACVALTGLGAPAALAAGPATPKTASRTIVIDGTRFEPALLSVQRGDVVTWANKDPFPHTATAKGTFDSGNIGAGKSWRFKARKAGTFDYVCTLHPNMKGTLVVR